jgi:hypothetical protein
MRHIGSSFDFRGPFQLPGTQLFRDFCASCIKRYCLEGAVQKARVRVYGHPLGGQQLRAPAQ